MIIDTSKLKDQYVYLKLDDGSEIHVKLDDEGVVIDHWVEGEVQESTWREYQEMIDGEEDVQLWAIFGKHPILGRMDVIDIDTKKKNEIHENMRMSGYTNIEIYTMEDWKIIKGKK
jgi:hypothetical protein